MNRTTLDGERFKGIVIAATQRLIQTQQTLNRINVFPVADSDTGTNMALTMQRVADSARTCAYDNLDVVGETLADSAVMGARGNSGAILAQFFQGLSEGFSGRPKVTVTEFAESARHAAMRAREAIANPREGTILTVIHDWAQYVHERCLRTSDFPTLIRSSLRVATESLYRTPEKLRVLARAGVVDAGAQGFVHMLEGAVNFIRTGRIERVARELVALQTTRAVVKEAPESITYRYCTQAMIRSNRIDLGALKAILSPWGDSLIVAGSAQRVRVHIHTNDPEAVYSAAAAFGTVSDANADDMHAQHSLAHHDPGLDTVAIVTDSACDLPADVLIHHNIQVVPLLVTFGTDTYVDKITINADDFYRRLAATPEQPTTSQPAPGDFQRVYASLRGNYHHALVVCLSSALSGTYQAALAGARVFNEANEGLRVEVVDSRLVTGALGLVVLAAAEAAERGGDIEVVRRAAETAARNTRLFISVDTMEYLVRGGRVSPLRGAIARVLRLKPVLTISPGGKAVPAARSFGGRHARRKLIDLLEREVDGSSVGLHFLVGHAAAPESARWYASEIKSRFGVTDVPIVAVSPVLGAHAGPGAVGVAFTRSDTPL